MIISIATLSIPGINASNHNASSKKECKKGLPELCSKMPFLRVTRPKGEPISQNDGRCSTSLSQPHRQPLLFDGQNSIDTQNLSSYTPTVNKQCLINSRAWSRHSFLPNSNRRQQLEVFYEASV